MFRNNRFVGSALRAFELLIRTIVERFKISDGTGRKIYQKVQKITI